MKWKCKRSDSRLHLVNLINFPKCKRSDSHLDFLNIFKIQKSKRSQITPFIIVAVVILAILCIFIFLNSRPVSEVKIPDTIQPIDSYIQDCVEKTIDDGINYISQTGGYYDLPNKSIELGVAYYIYDNKNLMPSREQIEKELAKYINNELVFCTDFENFQDYGIENGEVNSSVQILDDKVMANIYYPITINKENKTYLLDNWQTEKNIRLGIVYSAVKQIIEQQISNKAGICIVCLDEISEKNDLTIRSIDYSPDEMIYTIEDENSKINNESLIFNFVNKYTFE